MAGVSLKKLFKSFGGKVAAVNGLDLEIASGEFISLVGPSGCGKSTTLHLIAGLESATSGNILMDGRPVDGLSPKERDIALVFQSYALYPHMDVRGNLAFPLKVGGVARDEIDARVRETAQMLGLSALLQRKPKELSGGQRQRVALGRALIRRPQIFLFDEPLSNLDAALRGQMRAEIKLLHQKLGATFIYVTHDQAEAMTLSDRVVVMREGNIEQVGPPREIYAAPNSTFVAKFFGTPQINLLAPETLKLGAAPGVVLGVRPEDVEVGAGAAPEKGIAGRVELLEPMGPETFITAKVGEERVIARGPADFPGAPGSECWVRVDEGALHRFDASTGKRTS
jgi:multiple sugar transport system ATP-binding protein